MPLPRHRGHMPKRRFDDAPVNCEAGRRDGCATWCCRVLLVLVAREDLEDGLETEPGFLDLLRKDDRGACAYLREDGGCAVWERRPLDCRVFSCEGRERPSLLKLCGHGSPTEPDAPPPATTACAHCGETAGHVARFVWKDHRIRCAACGGPYLPRVIAGSPLRLRVDPAHRSEAERLAQRAETREYLGDPGASLEDFEAAAREEPDEIEHALARIRLATRLGDEVREAAAFDDAQRLDEARAWLARGLALDVLDRCEDSWPALRRAESLGSRSVGLLWAMARADRAHGRAADAVARIEAALTLGGPDVRIVQDLVDLAREGVPGAREAIESTGDRRAKAALGIAAPWLEP